MPRWVGTLRSTTSGLSRHGLCVPVLACRLRGRDYVFCEPCSVRPLQDERQVSRGSAGHRADGGLPTARSIRGVEPDGCTDGGSARLLGRERITRAHPGAAGLREEPAPPPLPRDGWTVSASDEEISGESGRAANVLDGNPATFWHSKGSASAAPVPHTLTIDTKVTQNISGLRYLPRRRRRERPDRQLRDHGEHQRHHMGRPGGPAGPGRTTVPRKA